jgi:hypothetical protein
MDIGTEKEQILVANTVREDLSNWDAAIAAHVESIIGEYMYDANRKVQGGVDYVGSDIHFKESVPEAARDKIRELVDQNLSQDIAESTEQSAYRGGMVVDRIPGTDSDSQYLQRMETLDRLKSNPRATEIEMMRNPEQYNIAPKIFSGEVVSRFGGNGPDESGGNTMLMGIKPTGVTKPIGIIVPERLSDTVKLGDNVRVQFVGKYKSMSITPLEKGVEMDLGR